MPTIKASMTTVNLATGEETHGTTDWHLLPLDTPNGECPECGRKHEPGDPHNQQSLHYQYSFYAKHNRWPAWADAMAHCTPETQAAWRAELEERGVKVDGEEKAE